MADDSARIAGGPLQRYVIAWAERQRAQASLERAQRTVELEGAAARETLRHHDGGPVVVELLGGMVCDVFLDTAGIVVVPRVAETVPSPRKAR